MARASPKKTNQSIRQIPRRFESCPPRIASTIWIQQIHSNSSTIRIASDHFFFFTNLHITRNASWSDNMDNAKKAENINTNELLNKSQKHFEKLARTRRQNDIQAITRKNSGTSTNSSYGFRATKNNANHRLRFPRLEVILSAIGLGKSLWLPLRRCTAGGHCKNEPSQTQIVETNP